jgi:hypothetical protein
VDGNFPDDAAAGDDLQPEYDFRSLRGVVRGKYAARYRERLRVVRLADDVATAFADEAAPISWAHLSGFRRVGAQRELPDRRGGPATVSG